MLVSKVKKIIYSFLSCFKVNGVYEKVVYLNCKINKLNLLGKFLSELFNIFIRIIFNCDISPYATLGKNVKIPHCVGIVVGCSAIIGDNTVIMPNVVLGAKYYPPRKVKRHPTIGANCLLGCNSVILGDITIEDNCVVAAGSKVTKDIKANTTIIQKEST